MCLLTTVIHKTKMEFSLNTYVICIRQITKQMSADVLHDAEITTSPCQNFYPGFLSYQHSDFRLYTSPWHVQHQATFVWCSKYRTEIQTLHVNSVASDDNPMQAAWNIDLQTLHVTDGNWPSTPRQLSPQTRRGSVASKWGSALTQ